MIFCSTTPSSRWLVIIIFTFHVFFSPHAHTFFFVFLSNTAAHTLKMSPRPFNLQSSIFSSVCLSLALSHFLFLSLVSFLSFSHSRFFGCLTPHTLSPLLSPELWPQGLWCPVCGAGYCSFGLLSKPTKLCSHWPWGSCRVCNHPA